MSGSDQEQLLNPGFIPSSFSHRGFALIGCALVLFYILFLILYVDSFWLATNVLLWGIPAAVAMVLLAHVMLAWVESPAVCVFLAPIFKRRPPIVYRRWLTVDETGITFGVKRIVWDSIDEANLTMFGNLVLKSRRLCGPELIERGKDRNPADVITKLPFSATSLESQKYFVEFLKSKRPGVILNARLNKQLAQPLLKGMSAVQGAAVVFLALVLMDFGYSQFRYLELLKEYYLTQESCLSGTSSSGAQHYDKAEAIRLNPLPISWISRQVMNKGTIMAGIEQARSEALWALGRKQESVEAAIKAKDEAVKSFAFHLRLARLYVDLNKVAEAKQEIEAVAEDHKDALLPRLYLISMSLAKSQEASARELYDNYLKQLNEEVFTRHPVWPPGGAPFLHELFYEDDLKFVFQNLLNKR